MDLTKLPDIGSLVAEKIDGKRTVYPCRAVRASSVGYFDEAEGGCLRRGVYEQTHWEEKTRPELGLQEVFEEGHMQEDACRPLLMKWLGEQGLVLRSGPPKAKDWDGMSGSIDGYIEPKEGGPWDGVFEIAVWEYKTLEYHRHETTDSLDDFRKSPYMRAWLAQGQCYMILEDIPLMCFSLKSKQAFRIKSFWMELDYDWAERLLKVRDEVKRHVAEKTLPDQVCNDACIRCPFVHICMPDIVGSGNFDILDSPELAEVLDRLGELKPIKKELDALDRKRKKLTPSGKSGICGDWMLSGQWVEKKEYTVAASKHWRVKAEKLDAALSKPEEEAAKGVA